MKKLALSDLNIANRIANGLKARSTQVASNVIDKTPVKAIISKTEKQLTNIAPILKNRPGIQKALTPLLKVSAFKDEITKLAVSADMMSFLKYLGTGLAVSAGLGAVAAGTAIGVNAYQQHKLDATKQPLFDQMLQLHPELKENKLRASLYFDTLWHYSPVIAQNPLSAGAYIRQALQMDSVAGGPLPQMVKELIEIAKSHNQSRQNLPSSPMGIMFSGITEAPKKALPSFMTYDQSGFAPAESIKIEPTKKVDHTHTHVYPNRPARTP
jgi:hypothetical protein